MRLSDRAETPSPSTWPRCRRRCCELTGEVADGWLGTSFVPEARRAYFTTSTQGLAAAGRTRADLDICQGAEVAFACDEDDARMVAGRKKELAFSLGGMGSATTNFYNDAYSRQGWAEVAAEVRDALAGGRPGRRRRPGHRRDGAGHHADRHRGHGARAAARVARRRGGHRRFYPAGDNLDARLATLGRAIDLVRALG